MIKDLFKVLIVVFLLVILIPLVMLLFGEGALAYKIFGWAFPKRDNQEVVVPSNTGTDGNTAPFHIDNNGETKQKATVKHIFVDHNTLKGGQKGMTITVEYEAKNLKDADLYCLVRFYNEDGSPVAQEHYNKKYLSVSGNVIVGEYNSPPDNDCLSKATLFMPYNELPHGGTERTDFSMDASILHYHSETEYDVLDRSQTYSFYLLNDM